MNFRHLQTQFLALLRARVRNGEITERGLARVAGISQPHLHNVLKGARLLSMEMADQILGSLRINLADLLTAREAAGLPGQTPVGSPAWRMVPLLDGWIGPGYPYPQALSQAEYPFLAADVERLQSPVAARLAPDPQRSPVMSGGGVVLLDCAEGLRRDPPEDSYFALDLSAGSTIGRVRRASAGWCLWSHESGKWQPISQAGPGSLDLIKGRVSLLVRQF